jgi:transposase InsO family protein
VLVVDVGSTLVLRVLKGYRDAQAAWLVAGAPGAPGGGGGGAAQEALLAVYAPRRGVVELWRPLRGERLGSLAAPQHGVLMQQAARPAPAAAAAGGRFLLNSCWCLDLVSLEMRDLTPELTALQQVRPQAAAQLEAGQDAT